MNGEIVETPFRHFGKARFRCYPAQTPKNPNIVPEKNPWIPASQRMFHAVLILPIIDHRLCEVPHVITERETRPQVDVSLMRHVQWEHADGRVAFFPCHRRWRCNAS